MFSLREWLIAQASLCLYFESRLSHASSVLLLLMVMAERKKGKASRVNTLSEALLDLCEGARVKRKTTYCLPLTCASSLFNAKVDS